MRIVDMRECSKSIPRRLSSPAFMGRYFRGDGVDIGGFPDPLALYAELFPLMRSVRVWDIADGDAQLMEGVADCWYDFVHSSHCLEHLHDPEQGLRNWFRILKPGGFLIVTVPDEDLYEQGEFPSTFNQDHKWTFTVFKTKSWSPRSRNVIDLLRALGEGADVERIEVLTSTYRYNAPRFDQTLTPIGECGIEFVVRKRSDAEVKTGGPQRRSAEFPQTLNKYFNQYRADLKTLKSENSSRPPFSDNSPID
ncbi:MAG: methyltransferase domain-containing protein [Hyphomonadaceae bacterium]|nr:methyltransferase domain-containing protein [Hyphomonadaceae bacterium]